LYSTIILSDKYCFSLPTDSLFVLTQLSYPTAHTPDGIAGGGVKRYLSYKRRKKKDSV